jgi:hypothetical protein
VALVQLEDFEAERGKRYPAIGRRQAMQKDLLETIAAELHRTTAPRPSPRRKMTIALFAALSRGCFFKRRVLLIGLSPIRSLLSE